MTGAAAFLRFSRDKRGYEHFYLVHPTTNRRGRTRSRILYWFRTPPGVKVGRLPFDDEVRRTIEAQNPGVTFDWKRLLATPIPPPAPDVERWRERRRAERVEKAARRAEEAAEREVQGEESAAASAVVVEGEPAHPQAEPSAPIEAVAPDTARDPSARPPGRRRRRRRGGRGGRKGPPEGGGDVQKD